MNVQTFIVAGICWLLIVTYFSLYKGNKNFSFKFITRKKNKENSPYRRDENLSEESEIINKSLDSGEIALLIKVDKNLEINPKLIHDLEEDIQKVIYRKQRGEEIIIPESKTNKESKDFNDYINIIK